MPNSILFTPEPSGILEPLDAQISRAIYTVAPEREQELIELIAKHRITIRMERVNPEHIYGAIASLGLAQFSLQGFERLYAYCAGASYAFMRQQAVQGFVPFSFAEDEAGQETQRLLQWAYRADAKDEFGNNAVWPSSQLLPLNYRYHDRLVRLTDELFLGAVAFTTLHEIGHIVLGHGATSRRDEDFRQEFEADEFAYDWIMDKWSEPTGDNLIFVKRSTMTASMMAIIAVLTLYSPTDVVRITHPNPIDRLSRFLLKHVNEDSLLDWKKAWGISTLVLNTHLSNIPGYDATQRWPSGRLFLEHVRPYFIKRELPAT
jgi:hypothetical protein